MCGGGDSGGRLLHRLPRQVQQQRQAVRSKAHVRQQRGRSGRLQARDRDHQVAERAQQEHTQVRGQRDPAPHGRDLRDPAPHQVLQTWRPRAAHQ